MFDQKYYEPALAAACAGYEGALDGAAVLVTGATGLIGSFLVDALAWLNENRGAGIGIHAAGAG